MLQKDIGRFICEMRKKQGLTQKQLGEKIRVSRMTIVRWESGADMPDASFIPVLCVALHVDLAELVKGGKIEESSVKREDIEPLFRRAFAIFSRRHIKMPVIRSCVLFVLMIACMIFIYQCEFNVFADSHAELEKAIDKYHFDAPMESDVLKYEADGDRMFVLYRQKKHPTACGLAIMQRGVFGTYRILAAEDSNYPLVQTKVYRAGNGSWLITYGVNDLPGVKRFIIAGTWRNQFSGETEPQILKKEYLGSPFIYVDQIDRYSSFSEQDVIYYAKDGNVIAAADLIGGYGIDTYAAESGYGSAELWMLYVIEAAVFLFGILMIRFFLKPLRR